MNLKLDKATMVTIGKIGGKVGKAIIVEGIKGVLLKGATAAITTSWNQGIDGVKELKLDNYLKGKGIKGDGTRKKLKLFKKRKGEEAVVEILDAVESNGSNEEI